MKILLNPNNKILDTVIQTKYGIVEPRAETSSEPRIVEAKIQTSSSF